MCPPSGAGLQQYWCPTPTQDGSKKCVDANKVRQILENKEKFKKNKKITFAYFYVIYDIIV